MFADVYSGRRVLVTGHTGFKGSWLTAWLLRLGAEVGGFSLDVPTEPANFEVLDLASKIAHFPGDLRDREALERAFDEFKPEMVFHLAAQALVRRSYDDPAATFETNALGTMNVMEALRTSDTVQTAVLITSDKCYRNVEWEWGYRETDHLGGEDPYSASKGCAELIAWSYMHSFFSDGPACATTRAGNVVGGGDWALDRIVPDCARAWAAGEAVEIRSPGATRPWQHVLEPLSGYLWLGVGLWKGADGLDKEAFNFGPRAEVDNTVGEVVEALVTHWPRFEMRLDPVGQGRAKESTLLKLCCDKALTRLSWRAILDFTTTMDLTADWYQAFYERGRDMFDLTMDQIEEYAARARAEEIQWALPG